MGRRPIDEPYDGDDEALAAAYHDAVDREIDLRREEERDRTDWFGNPLD